MGNQWPNWAWREPPYSWAPCSSHRSVSQQTLWGFPDLHVSLLPVPFSLTPHVPFSAHKKDYLAFIQQMATEPSLRALHCARGGGSAGWESREDPDYMDDNYIYCRGFLLSEKIRLLPRCYIYRKGLGFPCSITSSSFTSVSSLTDTWEIKINIIRGILLGSMNTVGVFLFYCLLDNNTLKPFIITIKA